MRQNAPAFDAFLQAPNKSPRLVVALLFPTPYYLTSHSDIPGMPAETLPSTLEDAPLGGPQLKPTEARSLIGRMSFSAIDVDGQVTALLRAQEAAGQGVKGTRVQLWRGGRGMDFSDFRLDATQRIEDTVENRFGRYSFRCQDIQ
ncbi:MAG: hypothetical protein AAFU65_18180, partial [Pseudomonadota bacterium]